MRKVIEFYKNNKYKKTLTLIAVLFMLLIVFVISYAFLGPFVSNTTNTPIIVDGESVYLLEFNDGEPIALSPGSHNLNDSMGNLSSTTEPSVLLISNGNADLITENYNIYLQINNNTFTYSSDAEIPELLLTVIDPDGNEVTEITGLTYDTVNGVGGFDITRKSSLIELKSNHEISTNDNVDGILQNWSITITMLNLPIDQSINANKTFNAEIIFTQETLEAVRGPINPNLSNNLIATNANDATVNTDSLWYDYSNGNWANAVLVDNTNYSNYSSVASDTSIDTTDVIGEYVWIPRFKYKDGNIVFENNDEAKSTGNGTTSYKTHPAFTQGDIELDGFWVSKYLLSNNFNSNFFDDDLVDKMLYSKSNTNAYMFDMFLPNETNLEAYNSQISSLNSNSLFSFSGNSEIHGINEIEYDAIIKLINFTNSNYNYIYDDIPLIAEAEIIKSTTGNSTGLYDFDMENYYTNNSIAFNNTSYKSENSNLSSYRVNQPQFVNLGDNKPEFTDVVCIGKEECSISLSQNELSTVVQVLSSDLDGDVITTSVADNVGLFGSVDVNASNGLTIYTLDEFSNNNLKKELDLFYRGVDKNDKFTFIFTTDQHVSTVDISFKISGMSLRGHRAVIVQK